MLFSILFVLAFLAQRIGACNPCKQDGYYMTLVDTKFYVGAEYWRCSELEDRKNEFNANTCPIMQSYALKYCGCVNRNRNGKPKKPFRIAKMCNICGGPNGSNFHSPDASSWNNNVGSGSLGLTATCGFFYQTGLQGAFGGQRNANCHTLQESTRAICSCRGPSW
jgi:hypothetical protein